MDIDGCANCLMHGWKQVRDKRELQQCENCKVIKYCGKECQAEHWKKVHKKQCRYFADPVKAQRWGHDGETCAICIHTAKVSKAKLKRPDNPNYQCIFKEVFPTGYHPHPFPITGDPESTFEKAVIVLWQLLKKFELTQRKVSRKFRKDLEIAFAGLKMMRLKMWRARKLGKGWELLQSSPMEIIVKMDDLLHVMEDQVESEFLNDPLGLWEVIQVVQFMLTDILVSEQLAILQNPLANIPADLNTIVSKGVVSSPKFMDIANQLLDALATKVVPFEEVLRIICGGSLEKTCSFCSKNITIDDINTLLFEDSCSVLFNSLVVDNYVCESDICQEKWEEMIPDFVTFGEAVITTMTERKATQCDFCFKLPPRHGAHRCTKCFTVMYCGTNCQEQDWKIHKEFCKKDTDKRKIKFGSSGRKEEASNNLQLKEIVNAVVLEEELNKGLSDLDLEASKLVAEMNSQVLRKFRNKNAPKKTDK